MKEQETKTPGSGRSYKVRPVVAAIAGVKVTHLLPQESLAFIRMHADQRAVQIENPVFIHIILLSERQCSKEAL